jgi:hypothetical protein
MSKVFYHGTAASNVPAILKEGIKPHAGHGADNWAQEHDPFLTDGIIHYDAIDDSRGQSVYLSKRLDIAARFAEMAGEENKTAWAVIRVTLPDDAEIVEDRASMPDGSHNPLEAFRYVGTVPPAWCKQVKGVIHPTLLPFEQTGGI